MLSVSARRCTGTVPGVPPPDHLVEQLVELSEQFDAQNQALRDRVVELMSLAEHQVAARVYLAQDYERLQAEHGAVLERLAEIEAQLARTEEALRAIEQSKLFRAVAPARRFYARLRVRSGKA
jgi:hypothetical protein